MAVAAPWLGVALPASAASILPPPTAPFDGCPNQGFQLQTEPGRQTRLGYFDLDRSVFVPIGSVGSDTNAFGYSREQGVFWGMRTANPTLDTLVRIDSKANTTDVGPLLDGAVPAPTALTTNTGTVADNKLYLHTKVPVNELIVADVDPDSPTFRQVLRRVVLDKATSGHPYLEIGDWDFDPATGRLISLAMDGKTKRLLVSIDPANGHVSVLADLSQQLPDGQNYGAVYVEEGGSQTVYVSNNDVGRRLDQGKPNPRSQTFGIRYGESPMVVTAYKPGPALLINDGADCLVATDFGDAPDSYHTDSVTGGPGHILTSAAHPGKKLTIGSVIDADLNGIPGAAATGDDLNMPVNDEDGVPAGTTLDGSEPWVRVPVTNTTGSAATLAGWIDLDHSGTFDAGERVVKSLAAAATSADLVWSAGQAGDTYLRLRLYPGTVANPQPDGADFIVGGEVEDHRIRLEPMLPVSGDDTAELITWGLMMITGGAALVAMAGSPRRGAIAWGRRRSATPAAGAR
jgi:hypothetical protein